MTIVRDTQTLVRETRQALGLTLAELAGLLNVTGENVRQWELGSYDIRKVPGIQDIVGMEPGPARDFWLDLHMIRCRRDRLYAIEQLRNADVPV